jgi:MFS family permease
VGAPAGSELVRRRRELSTTPPTGLRAAWGVIRSRNFGPYFVGNAFSASGTWFQNLAASILIFQLTHSAFMLGVLNFCQFAPVLLLAPWSGGVADRFDRRKLLLVTQSAAAAVSASLAVVTWDGRATAWAVIAFSAALGVITAFSNPAQTAMVGSLVEREDLPQAIALNSMTFNLARAIGPVTAAAVIAAFGSAAAFAVNAGSYLLFVAALAVIRLRETARARRAPFRESIALVRRNPHLAVYLLVVLTISFSTDPVNTESPAFAEEFGLHTAWAGAVVGAFGVGAVVAALFFAGRVTGTRRRMALTLAFCGGGILLFSLSPWFALGLVFLAGAGFGYLGSNASATSRLQLGVAEHERGRIMALWSIAFLGIRPIASIIDGALAGAFGVRTAGVVMSLPALFGAALAANLIRMRLPVPGEKPA